MVNIMIREKIAPILLKFYNPEIMKYLIQNRLFYSDENKLHNYQKQRLEKLLFHAYENTKYYYDIFEDVYLIRDGKINWDRFENIPLLTKKIIRENHKDLIAKDNKSRVINENTSGGSTGEPVKFLQDSDYYNRMVADTIFFAEIYGKNLGDKEIKLWGSKRDFFKEKNSYKNRLINFFFNRTLLNSFKLNNQVIEKYIHIINSVKPKLIWTYVDSIFEVAKYINRHNIKNIFEPSNIICTAGTMYSEIFEEIQMAFPKSNILNQYGSREAGIIGIGNDDIKIFQHSLYIELFDKIENQFVTESGAGNVIVTVLNNYSMPLIKFDIGDIGESKNISGTNVNSLSKLNGRENSHIINKDGSLIHGELFTHLFYFIEEIKKFQVIQEDFDIFNINLELENSGIDNNKLNNIKKKINQIMDNECKINFHIIDNLPKLKSGKYQFVISKVRI